MGPAQEAGEQGVDLARIAVDERIEGGVVAVPPAEHELCAGVTFRVRVSSAMGFEGNPRRSEVPDGFAGFRIPDTFGPSGRSDWPRSAAEAATPGCTEQRPVHQIAPDRLHHRQVDERPMSP